MPEGRAEATEVDGQRPSGFGILPGIGGEADLVAAMAIARMSSEVESNFDAVFSSVEHICITTCHGQNIVHGTETLDHRGEVFENIGHNSSAICHGEVKETYEGWVSDTILARGLTVNVGGRFSLKVGGTCKERVIGKLCYIQRGMSSSLCIGHRTILNGVSANASTMRIRGYVGARVLTYLAAVITNGLFHLEQYYRVDSRAKMRVESIRLVLRNVGVLAKSTTPHPMHGRPLPPLPSGAPAHLETAGFADNSTLMEVVS